MKLLSNFYTLPEDRGFLAAIIGQVILTAVLMIICLTDDLISGSTAMKPIMIGALFSFGVWVSYTADLAKTYNRAMRLGLGFGGIVYFHAVTTFITAVVVSYVPDYLIADDSAGYILPFIIMVWNPFSRAMAKASLTYELAKVENDLRIIR